MRWRRRAVFKPASLTSLSAINFCNVLVEAGLPKGVVNLVTGGPEVGTRLSTHEDVAVVSFTGSSAVGRVVNQYVNASTIGAEVHLPFGGTKATGNGHREAGTAALVSGRSRIRCRADPRPA